MLKAVVIDVLCQLDSNGSSVAGVAFERRT
jgi:hypothetical protein